MPDLSSPLQVEQFFSSEPAADAETSAVGKLFSGLKLVLLDAAIITSCDFNLRSTGCRIFVQKHTTNRARNPPLMRVTLKHSPGNPLSKIDYEFKTRIEFGTMDGIIHKARASTILRDIGLMLECLSLKVRKKQK